MKISHVVGLVALAACGLMGLGVLFLHLEGLVRLSHSAILVLSIAVVVLITVLGFFLGVFYKSSEGEENNSYKSAAERLKTALAAARKARLEMSLDKRKLRQKIAALEEKLKEYSSDPLPPADSYEHELSDDDLELNAEVQELTDKCELLTERCDQLQVEMDIREKKISDLKTDLLVAKTDAEMARNSAKAIEKEEKTRLIPVEFQGKTLSDILDGVVSLMEVRVALVADDQGLVVDTAGEYLEPDALAAVSSLVAELSPRVTELLPIGDIVTVALGDANRDVMEVRYFNLLGARCALAIIRKESSAHPELSRKAVDTIIARLQ